MENKPIGYRFKALEIVSKSMEPMPSNGIKGNFLFGVRVEIRVQAENNLVIPFIYVDISDDTTKAASIVVACAFEVDNFKDNIKTNEKGLYVVPLELQNMITPMSISTTRGIIFSEFRGSWLHNALMPAIPVNQLKAKGQEPASVKKSK